MKFNERTYFLAIRRARDNEKLQYRNYKSGVVDENVWKRAIILRHRIEQRWVREHG